MKKSLLAMTALAATLFAGCTSSDELTTLESIKQAENAPAPISFGTYMGKQATTRTVGGSIGAIITNETLQSKGFGVFAYYTGKNTYGAQQGTTYTGETNPQANIAPNFMWNQQVTYSTVWTYSPLKYWPNEIQNGNVDKDTPIAQGGNTYGGKVSFFAYAPYLSAVPDGADEGIIGISSKDATGDPTINYVVPVTAGSVVDLLWGTKGDATGTAVITGGATGVVSNGSAAANTYAKTILSGYTMNADLTKQEIDGKVDFAFKHALAKVGGSNGLKIVTDADGTTAADPAANTKVTVKSVTIVARAKTSDNSNYYTSQAGTFNLATGNWTITGGTDPDQADAASTTYSITNSMLNATIKDKEGDTYANQPAGVNGTAAFVYANAEANPVIFIPGTRPELTITIDYMVRTADPNLNTGYSEVGQQITKTVTFGSVVELNKFYTLLIHLGLTSVKFTATTADWVSDGGSATEIKLPLNVD